MKLLLLVVGLLSAQAHAHSYFGALADSETLPTVASATLFHHGGVMHWALNVTDLAPGNITVSIVDGSPPSTVEKLVQLWSGAAAAADFDAAGEFGQAAVLTGMPLQDLMGHIGMGHIFLEVATPEGALYGAWEESTADGEPMAKPAADAHAGHAEPAMAAADKHAGHAQPAETAAKEDGHAGHAHRRLLFL